MSYLVVAVWLLALAVARALLGSGPRPAMLMLIVWTGVVCAPLVLAPDFYFSVRAAAFLFLMVLLAVVGSVLGQLSAHGSKPAQRQSLTRHSKKWIVAGSASGCLSCAIVLQDTGFSLANFLNLDLYLQMASSVTIERYTYNWTMPLSARILMAPAHCAAMIAATRAAAGVNQTRRDRALTLLPAIPAVILALIMTTRATFLFMGVLYASAYLAAWAYFHPLELRSLASRRNVTRAALVGSVIAVLFFALQIARSGEIDTTRFGEVLAHLRKWPLGTLGGFGSWFDSRDFGRDGMNYGYYTFTGLFSLLGIRSRVAGIITETTDVGAGQFTNIYSVFRGLIMDFGIIGCAAAMVLVGAVGAVAFRRARDGRAYALVPLICVYAFVLWSPIVSFYAYTAHIAAIALYACYLAAETGRGGAAHA